jgi:hypothetical protein
VRHRGGSHTPVREEDRQEPATRDVHARRGLDGRIVVLAAVAPYGLAVATAPAGWEVDRGEPGEVRTVLGRIGLVAVVVGLYAGGLSPFVAPWDELASWAIAGAFVALLAATVPRWRSSGPARERTTPALGTDAG